MTYLFNTPSGAAAFLYGLLVVGGAFGLTLLIHKLFGGDAGQAKKSEWFPLWYIIPIMVALAAYLIIVSR